MKAKVEKAREIGFCFGVRRAIATLEKAAREVGRIDSLGEVVHNEQVLQKLNQAGVRVIQKPNDVSEGTVAISAHGVTPEVEKALRDKDVKVIDTTCPFVRRAQIAARKLAEAGFFVLIYGDSEHQEVKGILGWAQGRGLATLDIETFLKLGKIPLKVGILSQTTQIPENFNRFVKGVIDVALTKDAEIRIIDTICHDIRNRQVVSSQLAKEVDLMLVIGGWSSANTRRLLELCSSVTEARQINRADEIDPAWLEGKKRIGITSGTSTPDQTIDEVTARLDSMT
jgi:4-hydroxy-3-methylbut-2-en-1-yl diphosphate reductase